MKLTSLQALFLGLVVVLAAPQPGHAQSAPDGGSRLGKLTGTVGRWLGQ